MTKAILFDFDGTLVDSAPGIVKTMEETFKRMAIMVPSDEEMRATIGMPLRDALQKLGQLNDADADKATALYRELFPIYEVGYIKVFPHVAETLDKLHERGMRMAIVTSRDRKSMELVAGKRNLTPYFETQITGADGIKAKPAPDMVLALLERMQLNAEEVLVVGDTTFDIEMGNSAGCKTVAVTYGNHSREKLESVTPTYIIDRFDELLPLCRQRGVINRFDKSRFR